MDSERVQVGAKGHADIMQDTLDVSSSIQLARSKTALEKALDNPLYIRIHGPFDALKYDLDKDRLKKSTADAFKTEAKEKVQQKIQEKKDRLHEKIQDKIKDKFKGLF